MMFVVEIGAVFVTALFLRDLSYSEGAIFQTGQIAIWLWFTVLFANFAEGLAEGRGRARADNLRQVQTEGVAKKIVDTQSSRIERVSSLSLRIGDLVRVEAGDMIPGDGEVVGGIATVNESAITGESAPVIREAGGDRSSVTGGTTVVSDWIAVKVTANPGQSFIDRMIGLVEGAKRQKTPNEIALTILLAGMTLLFLIVCATLECFAHYAGQLLPVFALIALLVTLIPTTIGGLLPAIGIAGMDRLIERNLVAKSGRAVEAAGDVDVLLLDKTGTITFGNRMADAFVPVQGIEPSILAGAAKLSSLHDETPEGKSTVDFASRQPSNGGNQEIVRSIEFTAQTRLSGVDLADGTELRKGAVDAILTWIGGESSTPRNVLESLNTTVEQIARTGGTPLAVARKINGKPELLGVIHLKDIVKPGIRKRFAQLRQMGIRTVMVTGDNPLTAASIAAEAGVDDFLAEATPEKKLELIRAEQASGRMVAMAGDGTNDAPALAQADVGVAMNDGTPAAKEAANLIDLDSDPTKLIEVVMVGKQLLISRGALTTFSIANDVAKYFAIIPALFLGVYPQLASLNLMGLTNARSALLSAVIFNALIIIALIPLALRGVRYVPDSASALLRRNLLIYGLGGLILPFLGIKVIDIAVHALGLA